MLAAITGFLAALPQLISLITNFMGWVNRVSGNDPAGFINKIGDAFKQLSEAQSDADHAAAAKALADAIGNLPSK
jgi:hypothetical protein